MAKYFRSFFIVLLLSLLAINSFDVFVYCDVGDTCLFISPSMYVAEEIGEIFDVAINVSGVINLHSLEFTLTYNTSLLDVKQVFQGPFFPVPPSSNFEFENNELLGLIEVNMSLVDLGTSKSGDGDLVQISFKAVTGSQSCASSPFGLQQTLLLDAGLKPIPHESVGGVYFWKSMQPDPPAAGRLLDLYTQKGGKGPNEPDGVFVIGERVYLTSRVTYNDYPVQQKLVAFGIQNPLNQTISRTAVTDEEGLATMTIEIPFVPGINGTWSAISLVDIAGEIVWDTITFQVVLEAPVGGFSFSMKRDTGREHLAFYTAIMVVLVAAFTATKRKIRFT